MDREAPAQGASRGLGLIQECHVSHRAALGFRVHQNTVPERQRDRGMVGVAHCSAGENAHVAAHHSPLPTRGVRIRLEQAHVFARQETIRVL